MISLSRPPSSRRFWLWPVLVYAALWATLGIRQAFHGSYVLADDVREHVFWMFRFVDPTLFPNDPIANYFQVLAPPGFGALYHALALAGLSPLIASKVIPPILGLVSAGFMFALGRRVLHSSPAAAIAGMFLVQVLWLTPDLCSATPRAFFYPLFTAFLYYHVRGNAARMLTTLGLLALFFPPGAMIAVCVAGFSFFMGKRGAPPIRERSREIFLLAALGILAGALLLLYWSFTRRAGPMISYAEAVGMPEFGPKGRVPFFGSSRLSYWLEGGSGIHLPITTRCFYAAFLWPVLWFFPKQFPQLRQSHLPRFFLLVTLGALTCFLIAHAVLFRLYLPSRYTEHTLRILFVLPAAEVIAVLAGKLWEGAERARLSKQRNLFLGKRALAGALVFCALCWPFVLLRHYPKAGYVSGSEPKLYQFFASKPREIRIASTAAEADNLPTFCRRSVIVSPETAVPFHPQYYLPLRARAEEIVAAEQSADLGQIQQCIVRQRIDYWLMDVRRGKKKQKGGLARLLHLKEVGPPDGREPWLENPPGECVAYADDRFVVLDAKRITALNATGGIDLNRTLASAPR